MNKISKQIDNNDDSSYTESKEQRLKELSELEDIVRKSENNSLEAGKALNTIKEKKLYKEQETEGTEKTWNKYCQRTYGFTPQYANKLINANRCHERIKNSFDGSGRGEEFKQLPNSVRFWSQLDKMPEDKQGEVVDSLYDKDNKSLKNDWESTWGEAFKQQRNPQKDARLDEDAQALAKNVADIISDKGDITGKLSDLSNSAVKQFAKALVQEVKGSTKDNQDKE